MVIRRVKSQIEPPPRKVMRSRSANFKMVDLKRAISGAMRAGLEIGEVDIQRDGTITLRTASQPPGKAGSMFDEWEDQL